MIDEITPLKDELEKNIRILVNPLKEEDELYKILKVKLTKKEFKVLKTWAHDDSIEELLTKIGINEERYKELSLKLIKKLNQEKLKQEICI
ncbi:hypothetical protein MNB_SV-14-1717 [hydrothermal vent metagenome]|uniref:Uncharacterized protein n=1 Tax=hydrothermal vent metagenome TaxID=652676 RepID=A0A1W1CVX8_9ZZZZ